MLKIDKPIIIEELFECGNVNDEFNRKDKIQQIEIEDEIIEDKNDVGITIDKIGRAHV